MEVYGLLGNPVGHSLSPPMHEAAYEALGLEARYVTFEPAPERLGAAIDGAAALGIAGVNVTIPFKERVLEFVAPDDLAGRIGAINTIDFTPTPAAGYNTDAAGARRALERHNVAIEGREAVLLGAGGAGRAIAFMLAESGAHVRVANRTVDRAESLAAAVGGTGHGLDGLEALLESADVLINATSVGMDEDRSPVPDGALHADLTVMDAVYSPPRTRLLRDADARGAATIDGAWMLLYQGVEAFERWTGRSAPVSVMNEALRSRL